MVCVLNNRWSRLRWRLLGLFSLALLGLTGCSSTPTADAGKSVAGVSATASSTGGKAKRGQLAGINWTPLAQKWVKALQADPNGAKLRQQGSAIYLDDIAYAGATEIDAAALSKTLRQQLRKAGFKLVSDGQAEDIKSQLEYQQAGGTPDTASLVRLGKQLGASCLIYGTLTDHSRSGKAVITYRLNTDLMDLGSGELLWHNEQSFRRSSR